MCFCDGFILLQFPDNIFSLTHPYRLGMAIGPMGMDTHRFRTRWTWIRVGNLTRGSYRVGYPKYVG
jgi:hypothetical protein